MSEEIKKEYPKEISTTRFKEYIKEKCPAIRVICDFGDDTFIFGKNNKIEIDRTQHEGRLLCILCKSPERQLRVNTDKDIFYCMSCHMGGDAICFVAFMNKCGAGEAMRFLVKHYRIKFPSDMVMDLLKIIAEFDWK